MIEWSPVRDPKKNTSYLYGQIRGIELYYKPLYRGPIFDGQGRYIPGQEMVSSRGVRVWAYVQNEEHFTRAWLGKFTDTDSDNNTLEEIDVRLDDLLGKIVRVRSLFNQSQGQFKSVDEIFQSQTDALINLFEYSSQAYYRRKYIASISPDISQFS